MALNPYSPCPCGSGKKLKFCCSDLAVEIEKVQQMVSGEQPHAALKRVEQLLKKQPTCASLLDLRTSLELSLHEFDAAGKTIEAFLKADPQNPSAHAQAALLASVTGLGTQSIGPLQDALERLDEDMPLRVLEAIGAVGQALLVEGELVAARGHLLLYAAIAPKGDNRAIELLLRMNLQAGLPLLMREYLLPAACPPEVSWQTQFDKASSLSSRGQWRQAELLLSQLREEAGPVPAVVFNLALMRGWLGQSAALASGLHEYAALETASDEIASDNESLDNAVEAEALAQLIDPELVDPTLDTLNCAYPITEIETLTERLLADKRVEDYPLDKQDQEDDQAPRPRSTHMLLDRATPATGVDLPRSEVPSVIAFLSIFGKRTDREARLEVTTDRDSRFDQVQELLAEVTGDTIGELAEDEVLTQKSLSEEALSWRWRLPDDTPPDHRRQLLSEQRREAILTRWTAVPRAALDGKSPQEAVGKASLRIALMASALILEQAASELGELPLYADLRRQLELPEPASIDPTGLDLEQIPMVRVPRLEISKLADEPLAKLLDRSVLMGAHLPTLLVARELVDRPQLDEGVDLQPAYRQLIRLANNPEHAFGLVEKARAWALSKGLSAAEWTLMELELSIRNGVAEKLMQVLNEIQEKHVDEPGVAEATHRMLAEAGLLAPPTAAGQPAGRPMPPDAGGAAGETLWTPDDSRSAEPAKSDRKSAIWTPS